MSIFIILTPYDILYEKSLSLFLALFIAAQHFTIYGKENCVNKRYNMLAYKQIITTTVTDIKNLPAGCIPLRLGARLA